VAQGFSKAPTVNHPPPGGTGRERRAFAAQSPADLYGMQQEADSVGQEDQGDQGEQSTSVPLSTSVHEANRAKKAVSSNVKAIENRIRFFQREEEKIWRDLEEVRRQAATIEEGRSRTLEKKLADRSIAQARTLALEQNRVRAAGQRSTGAEMRQRNQYNNAREKQVQGEAQRKIREDISRQKKYNDAQVRLQNSERAVAIQRQQLEARLKVNSERAGKLDRLRVEQEAERQQAEAEVEEVGSRLPALEAEEMACLQRLQNSRIVTQSVLEELETSLGSRSSVTNLLRQKQRQQADPTLFENLDGAQTPVDASGMVLQGGYAEDARPVTR